MFEVEVEAETRAALAEIACGRVNGLVATGPDDASKYAIDLDDRTSGLLGIAALIEATASEILGALWAIAPQVGRARIVAAASEIMLALGLSLPETAEPGQ
jgi:hypothetical protein